MRHFSAETSLTNSIYTEDKLKGNTTNVVLMERTYYERFIIIQPGSMPMVLHIISILIIGKVYKIK